MNGATAGDLAHTLLPHLEALANVHFLLDTNIESPSHLKRLRQLEEEIFTVVLRVVLEASRAEGRLPTG